MTDGIKSRSAVSPTFLLGLIGSIFGIVSGVLIIVLGVGLGATIAEIASLFGTSAGDVSIIYAWESKLCSSLCLGSLEVPFS